jgi:hypothetical protein
MGTLAACDPLTGPEPGPGPHVLKGTLATISVLKGTLATRETCRTRRT